MLIEQAKSEYSKYLDTIVMQLFEIVKLTDIKEEDGLAYLVCQNLDGVLKYWNADIPFIPLKSNIPAADYRYMDDVWNLNFKRIKRIK